MADFCFLFSFCSNLDCSTVEASTPESNQIKSNPTGAKSKWDTGGANTQTDNTVDTQCHQNIQRFLYVGSLTYSHKAHKPSILQVKFKKQKFWPHWTWWCDHKRINLNWRPILGDHWHLLTPVLLLPFGFSRWSRRCDSGWAPVNICP